MHLQERRRKKYDVDGGWAEVQDVLDEAKVRHEKFEAQKQDADNLSSMNVGEEIFSLFLEILSSTIVCIAQMKRCTSENSTNGQMKYINKQYLNK